MKECIIFTLKDHVEYFERVIDAIIRAYFRGEIENTEVIYLYLDKQKLARELLKEVRSWPDT